MPNTQTKPFKKILVANRGEISIRVMRASAELGIHTVSVYSYEDRFALHRFKADESYQVGKGKPPVAAYLDIDDVIRIAKAARVDAIHPGYGFLSENPDFAEACAAADIAFIGPLPETMRRLGNKVSARELAKKAKVPVMPATDPLPADMREVAKLAKEVGYPVMLKASWGGGGRGMRVIENEKQLKDTVDSAKREAKAAFGNDEVYLEKLVRKARHVEVQIFGDHYGNLVHLYERDCTVQRRHQKVVERAPAQYLTKRQRERMCEAALRIGRAVGYRNAGTVEFLQDADTGDFYFIEVNPRIQVEHTVTEVVTGIDLVKAQILAAEGHAIGGKAESVMPRQEEIEVRGYAIQCRVTNENPAKDFMPEPGRMTAYRSASGFGIRLDAGTAFAGALITPHYDSLLVKVTSIGRSPLEAAKRMDRALREFRVRGVSTNLRFLEEIVNHPKFIAADYTTRFIDETPELFRGEPRRDRATRLLGFIGDVIVNGNAEVKGRVEPTVLVTPAAPEFLGGKVPAGNAQRLKKLGPEGFAKWMLAQKRVLVTDTTMRDAHQSLLATRMRSYDMVQIAPAYARLLPDLLSIESWGGATFDVAMRFLKESPWRRLARLRERMPNHLQQMLLRASNAVGYTNYPDNAVHYFVKEAADAGVDIFRVFDSLNWVENMRVAMDSVLESGKVLEAAICYAGDLTDPQRPKYDLNYYVKMARELEAAGAHILGIKDMAGLCRPAAAKKLVETLKQEVGIPIHFHTHDTSGIAGASVLAAIDAGVDAVDAAMDSFSGFTSQPNLGSIVEALRNTPRDTGLDPQIIRRVSHYWEDVRRNYAAFESDIKSSTSEVYLHEMPGGQYTNLREQARSMGLDARWPEVARMYAEVNQMFGDVIKVTPTSKIVGDLALMMVTSNLTVADVADPDKDIAFPDSVVSFFRGDIGQPYGGFPEALQKKVLKDEEPLTARPGAVMKPLDLAATRKTAEKEAGRHLNDQQFASYLMYPKVFVDYAKHRSRFGEVSVLPTPVFFYGMKQGEEIGVEIQRGKRLVIRFLALGEPDDEGMRDVFFELNGEPRSVKVQDHKKEGAKKTHVKADPDDPGQIGAPMPGAVAAVTVEIGQKVNRGDALMTIEAMKIEAVARAKAAGTIAEIAAPVGTQVQADDLLVVMKV